MSKRRNFPEDFFDRAEDDPILGETLVGESDSTTASASTRTYASSDSVFAPMSTFQGSNGASDTQTDGPRERAILVTRGEQTSGVDELNAALDNGWTIKHVALMSTNASHARSDHFSALVVLRM